MKFDVKRFGYGLCVADAILTELPPGVLYRVKATYKYVKEDVDELSFEVGDTIQVIEYDDPEDQVLLVYYYLLLYKNGTVRLELSFCAKKHRNSQKSKPT